MNEDQKNKLIMQMDADRRNLMTDDFLKRADAEAKLNEIKNIIQPLLKEHGIQSNEMYFGPMEGEKPRSAEDREKLLEDFCLGLEKIRELVQSKKPRVHIVRDYRKPQS